MDKLTMPSREFLVRQAVLNAAAKLYPVSHSKCLASGKYDQLIGDGRRPLWPDCSDLYSETRAQFRALVSQYEPATMEAAE